MPNFTTKTEVPLKVEWKTGPINRVTITGEREKLLYEGDDATFAREVYDGVVAHYGAREKARTDNSAKGKAEQDRAEAAVDYIPPKKARE